MYDTHPRPCPAAASPASPLHQDGNGHFVIKPIRNGSGQWTSGRIETQRTDLAARRRRQTVLRSRAAAAERQRCRRSRLLAGSGERACGSCQTGFHTYAMELDRSTSPEQIRWYLDGNNFLTVNSNQMDATIWNNATHHGFFMILDVAIGGSFRQRSAAAAPPPPGPACR